MTGRSDEDHTVPYALSVVVPVKRLVLAKSRLGLPADDRQRLALAFALDTIASLCRSAVVADVLVVTSDPVVRRRVGRLGVRVTPETGRGHEGAIRAGIAVAARWRPRSGLAVAPADLPCLRPAYVSRVVIDAAQGSAFVPDRAGTGTTLVIHPPGRHPATCYGPGSAVRHQSLGLFPLLSAPAGARQDVDTLDDLAQAAALGLGDATLTAIERLDLTDHLGRRLGAGSQDLFNPRWQPIP